MNNLEIEKEKTRQLTLLRDIKKLELKLYLEKKYKKQSKSLKLFEQLQESDESDLEIDINTNSVASKSNDNSLEEIELK